MGNYEKPSFWYISRGVVDSGTLRTYAETSRDALLPFTEGCQNSPVAAAMMSVNPFTADRMLLVDLKKGDWVVQNGANSGVGQDVIRLARIRGIKTVNVIGDRCVIDHTG
jgi:mitochondrial enoyl-[acyl-carrier protein] reductase / trans-2-enoyl-CoA reductase